MRRSDAAHPMIGRRRRLLAAALAVLMGAGTTTLLQVEPAFAAAALTCDQSTVYGIDANKALKAIDVATGTTTTVTTLATNTNGLGVSDGGTHAYAFSSGTTANVLEDYDAVAGTTTPVTPVDGNVAAIRGAVNPANGLFYYAGNTTGGTPTYIGAYDPATHTTIGQVGGISVATAGSGGDMAFSKSGVLYFLTGNMIYRVDGAVPAVAGTGTLATTLITTISGSTSSPGLAFASNGFLYASSASTLKKIDPTSGDVVDTQTLSGSFSPSDLAGCNNPDSLASSVAVDARVHPSDQWTVTLGSGAAWPASSKVATTAGSGTGVQPQRAGPVLAVGGRSYTATLTMASGSPGDYDTAWACTDSLNTPLGSGSGTTATVSPPTGSGVNGSDIDCRFSVTAKTGAVSWAVQLGGARGSNDDQFVLDVHGGSAGGPVLATATTTGAGSTVGNGTAGPANVTVHRTAVLTAGMAPGSSLAFAQYGGTVTCTDQNGVQTGLPTNAAFTGPLTVDPVAGSDIRCVLTATPRPAGLTAGVALSANRFDDADQFTVSAEDGNGTVLGSSTTAGTGSSVTTGTGTTGALSLPGGAPVTIRAAATAHAARYARFLTCTDATPYTTGLPNHAAFTGSAVVTPAAGSDVSCTIGVEPSAGALTVDVTAPGSLTVGVPADYTLVVGNDGGTAVAPTTAVRLPAGIAFSGVDGTGWSCSANGTVSAGQLVTCTGPAVAAGGDRTATLHVLPSADSAGSTAIARATVDGNGGTAPAEPGTCTASSTCDAATARVVDPGIDLAITVTGPSALVQGVPAQYVLRVRNDGTGPAASATLADLLPDGTRLDSASGATCTANGRLVTCTVPGPIGPGAYQDVVLTVLPESVTPGASALNRATVDPDGGQAPATPTAGCTGTTCDSVSTPVQAPGLTLAIARQGSSSAPLVAGDVVRWVYTVTNTGAAVEQLATSDGTACSNTTLATGESTTCLTDARTLTQADIDSGRVQRVATASARTAGCLLGCGVGSNEASATLLTAQPDLAITITGPDALTVGVPADWRLEVRNGGGRTATPTVRVRLPEGIAYTLATGDGWTCAASGSVDAGQLVSCTGPAVGPGATRSVVLHAEPTRAARGSRVAVSATVDPLGGTAPADPGTCTASASCAVAAGRVVATGVALSVEVSGPAAIVNGVPAEYVLQVRNTGTGSADSATVRNLLPAGVRYLGATGADCTADGRLITCTVAGPIGPGGAKTVVLRVLPVDVKPADRLVDRATVDPDGGTRPAAPAAGCTVDDHCDADVSTPHLPTLALAVRVRGGSADGLAAGDRVRFVYTVTNTGKLPLGRIALSDGTTCAAARLAPGASTTCVSERHVVTAAEVARGRVTSAATASAVLAGCRADCRIASNRATATAPTVADATIGLALTSRFRDADGNRRLGVGETATWEARVTNTGKVGLTGLRVRGTLAGFRCPVTALAPGRSTTCTAERVVVAGDIVGGTVTNTAVATADGAVAGAVTSAHRTAVLSAGRGVPVLAHTGLDLRWPVGGALLLLLVAGAGGVALLRRRAVVLRRG